MWRVRGKRARGEKAERGIRGGREDEKRGEGEGEGARETVRGSKIEGREGRVRRKTEREKGG